MNVVPKKISKCYRGRCRTCQNVEECNTFRSFNTNLEYHPILKSCDTLNCMTENVVYLIYCKICHLQYVGETVNSIQVRFRGHRSSISSGNSSQIVHHHFYKDNHDLSNCVIVPIEKIEAPGLDKIGLDKLRREREAYWERLLQTSYPLGLNVRLKGVGDFHPSQENFRDFGGRRRRNKRLHGRRKPKSRRKQHVATVAYVTKQHENLKNSHTYMHFFKTYLYSLPRKQLLSLWNEVNQQNDRTDVRIKDIIVMISQLRLFKPVQIKEAKKRDYYHLQFIDKGLDFINLSGILRSPKIQSKIPVYFQDPEPPIIGYRYNPSIAGLIFNYKNALDPQYINSIDTNNFRCNCQDSVYKDDHHQHVITGNLDIIENVDLRNIIKKGPKYRLPKRINWRKNRENIVSFLELYSQKWLKKEKKIGDARDFDRFCLTAWKREVLNTVDRRIETGKKKLKDCHALLIEGTLKTELQRLHEKYVLTPADKAQNNIILTCKPYYIKKIKEELLGSNTYQIAIDNFDDIIKRTCDFSEGMGIKTVEEMKQLPLIYFIPKMHKNPTSQRFIAGSKLCSIKIISKLFSKCLKLILNHLSLYNNTVFQRSGIKLFWIIDNSIEFLNSIKNVKTSHLETYDFSTLYTSLPHTEIKSKFKTIFRKIFSREAKPYINVNLRKAFFASKNTKSYLSFTENELIMILDFILNNIFVRFGNQIFRQVIGIPIGLDSGQDIANLLLYHYESSYVDKLSKRNLNLARKFNTCTRYIDDLFSANFPEFKNHLPLIYPPELTINLSSPSNTMVDYLDVRIVSENQILCFSIFDKRDTFNFDVVNFPFLDSCIPRKPALGIFLSQLIRFARICSFFVDFSKRSLLLSKKLQYQGYKFKELRSLLVRFFHEKGVLLEKYHQRDINIFLVNTLHKFL